MAAGSRWAYAAPALVLVGLLAQEAGAAIAVLVFPTVGPVGMVALRLLFSALVLTAVSFRALRGVRLTHWRVMLGYGLVLAAMNVSFYLALDRIPLGIAVTIELLGPLVLSVVESRSRTGLLWAAIAAVGVILLGGTAHGLDWVGVALAALAGALWAGYILMARSAGAVLPGLTGLAIATGIGAVLTVPVAAGMVGAVLWSPQILALGLAVAILSSAIPYGIELTVLRRMKAETFAILLALAPAMAALAGMTLLGQPLTWAVAAGIALVVAAGIGAVRTAARASAPVTPEPELLPPQ